MKLKFQKPNTSINFVKRALKKIPETQRIIIANAMWFGTSIDNMPIHLKPFKAMFEDANKQAIGKAWKQLEEETIKFIDEQMSEKESDEYFKKLITKTYKNEPDKKHFIEEFFANPKRDYSEFKRIILNDIQECHAKAFKEHLEFWGC